MSRKDTEIAAVSQFETEMSTPSSAATQALYDAVRKELAPSLRPVFHSFRQNLIDAHAKDLGHDATPSTSGTSTPAVASAAAAAPTPAVAAAAAKKEPAKVSTSSSDVRVSSQLAASIQDLWDLLTNPAKIPMWTRAPAQVSAISHIGRIHDSLLTPVSCLSLRTV